MPVMQRRSFMPLNPPPTGYPKYRLETAGGTLVQDWTNSGVTQRTNSDGLGSPCFYVRLSLDPSLWYTIEWDNDDGAVTAEDFSGATGLDLALSGLTPRDLSAVADADLTVADALVAAIAVAAGDRAVVGTTFTTRTPAGTTVASKTLDSATTPTSLT